MTTKPKDICSGALIFSDGAWGTELAKLGNLGGCCAEIWNMQYPDRVEKVAKSYVDAGSRIILTNSFSGNRLRLREYKLDSQLKEINQRAVEISLKAAGDRALVVASMGPSGKMLASGDVSQEALGEIFSEQAAIFKSAGAQAAVAETMSDVDELKIAVKALKTAGLFAVASMSFDSGQDNMFTMMGVSVEDAVKAAEEAGADAVGANCGVGIEKLANICSAFKERGRLPIWIKGNAGLPELENNVPVYKMGPDDFAKHAAKIAELGANIIGGCCGTTPDHIRVLVKTLSK